MPRPTLVTGLVGARRAYLARFSSAADACQQMLREYEALYSLVQWSSISADTIGAWAATCAARSTGSTRNWRTCI